MRLVQWVFNGIWWIYNQLHDDGFFSPTWYLGASENWEIHQWLNVHRDSWSSSLSSMGLLTRSPFTAEYRLRRDYTCRREIFQIASLSDATTFLANLPPEVGIEPHGTSHTSTVGTAQTHQLLRQIAPSAARMVSSKRFRRSCNFESPCLETSWHDPNPRGLVELWMWTSLALMVFSVVYTVFFAVYEPDM